MIQFAFITELESISNIIDNTLDVSSKVSSQVLLVPARESGPSSRSRARLPRMPSLGRAKAVKASL